MLKDKIKKALSYILPIEKGTGITCDDVVDSVTIPVIDSALITDAEFKGHGYENKQVKQYFLRNNLEGFALVSVYHNSKSNNTSYKLENIMTGETFTISEKLVNFLFTSK